MTTPRNLHLVPAVEATIVVPTYNEGGNVAELVRRLAASCAGRAVEVLFVDDSTDDTPQVINAVADRSDMHVRMIHRAIEDRHDGLSGAVTLGMRSARGALVLVMDGDLQHPPELVPRMLDVAEQGFAMVVASRYCADGASSGLSSSWRRSVSSSSTLLARGMFPRRVGRTCSDPMTGFFCVRAAAVDLNALHPRGFKILLEILARHDLRVAEVPFVFAERGAGESKASWRQGVHFLRQLAALRFGRLAGFSAIGAVGVLLNLLIMAWLVHGIGLGYVLSSIIAAEVTIISNFVMLEKLVFADLRDGVHSLRRRALQAFTFNNLEALARIPVLVALVTLANVPSVVAQAALLGLAFLGRFLFVSRVVYRPRSVVPVLDRTPLTRKTAA